MFVFVFSFPHYFSSAAGAGPGRALCYHFTRFSVLPQLFECRFLPGNQRQFFQFCANLRIFAGYPANLRESAS